jgi:integrase
VFNTYRDNCLSAKMVKDALMMHMLTGQRVEEVLRARYENGWMIIDDTKTGRPHSIPVPRHAAGLSPGGQLRAMQVAKSKKFGSEFALRDMRRTWKTLAGEAGISKGLRDIYQNHANGSGVSTKHYDRYDYREEKLEACRLWEAYLDGIGITLERSS